MIGSNIADTSLGNGCKLPTASLAHPGAAGRSLNARSQVSSRIRAAFSPCSMQSATDIYATKMPIRDRAFWSKWLGVNLALQKSRAGFRRLVRKSAHGVRA